MNILLTGYGKMGKAIAELAVKRGHFISGIYDPSEGYPDGNFDSKTHDVAIEFSQPEAAPANLQKLIEAGIPVVCGTTGWLDRKEQILALLQQKSGGLVYGSNFSPGVNLLFRMNEMLAGWMNAFPEYDCSIEERHHKHKKDAPGGTALSLAKQVGENHSTKKHWVNEELKHRPLANDEISLSWIRAGGITGDHTVSWISPVDQISISHSAFSRSGFAAGAVLAAEWIPGKSGWHEFSDIFPELINKKHI